MVLRHATHRWGWFWGSALVVAACLLPSPSIADRSPREVATASAIPIIAVSEAQAKITRNYSIAVTVHIRTAGVATVTARYTAGRSHPTPYANPMKRTVGSALPPRINEEVMPEVVRFLIKPNSQGRRAIAKRRQLHVKIMVSLRTLTGVSVGAGTAITVVAR